MTTTAFKQDMPPEGGYAPITYKRIPLKSNWNSLLRVGIVLGISAVGWIGYHNTKRRVINNRIETRCARLALKAMLMAEHDRQLLKQLKRNRDLEEELMKNVEGWETGKWKGLPVYLTLGPNDYYRPYQGEYFAHAPESQMEYGFDIMKTT